MATGYEVQQYRNIERIANALEGLVKATERNADALERIAKTSEEWDFEFEVRLVNPPIERMPEEAKT